MFSPVDEVNPFYTHPMLNRIERALVAANRWLLIVLLAAMACIVFANVVLRYTTGDSIVWAEEVARHMMIWVTFLGAGLVLRFGGHVAIDNLHSAIGTRAARVLRRVIVLGLALFFVVMAISSSQYVWATRFQTTAATDIPISYVYAAMPVGFVLMLVHLIFIARGYVADGGFADSDEMDAEAAASI
jgi:TRAP-type C4-dicarboxylate transport system permease small subunit